MLEGNKRQHREALLEAAARHAAAAKQHESAAVRWELLGDVEKSQEERQLAHEERHRAARLAFQAQEGAEREGDDATEGRDPHGEGPT